MSARVVPLVGIAVSLGCTVVNFAPAWFGLGISNTFGYTLSVLGLIVAALWTFVLLGR